jgi:hypothetical protein
MNLEKYILTFLPEIKATLDPCVRAFKKSNQDEKARLDLTKGFDKAWELLFAKLFSYLNNLNDLSLTHLSQQMNKIRKKLDEPSVLFLVQFNHLKYGGEQFRKEFLKNLSLEAISRYGDTLINEIYTGDKILSEAWNDYIVATFFYFWNNKKNYSAYRMLGKQIEKLNKRSNCSFFPAHTLRPHDDTIDGYIPYAIGHGWFYHKKKLTSCFALSNDPFDDLFQRTQQCQACLAYYLNPLANTVGAKPRVSELVPGDLFAYDKKSQTLRIVSFSPTEIFEENGQVKIRSSHSEIEIIQL